MTLGDPTTPPGTTWSNSANSAAPDRPGDRDQQQAAEVAVQCEFRGRTVLTPAIAAAIAAARAEEAARWRAKIEALADVWSRSSEYRRASDLAARLRAVLDGEQR